MTLGRKKHKKTWLLLCKKIFHSKIPNCQLYSKPLDALMSHEMRAKSTACPSRGAHTLEYETIQRQNEDSFNYIECLLS